MGLATAINNQLPAKKIDKSLCYYINVTEELQTVRATNQGVCYLECLVFPGERVIFATLSNSYLEISSPDLPETTTTNIECKITIYLGHQLVLFIS